MGFLNNQQYVNSYVIGIFLNTVDNQGLCSKDPKAKPQGRLSRGQDKLDKVNFIGTLSSTCLFGINAIN